MKKAVKRNLGVAAAAAAAGVAAAGAGAYYFYASKDAKKHRKVAAAWMLKAEKEIKSQAGKLKDAAMNEKNYKQIVQTVSKKYQQANKVGGAELASFVKNLNGEWKKMKKQAPAAKKAVTKAVQKVAKKAAAKKK